jgi:hypothetical protein
MHAHAHALVCTHARIRRTTHACTLADIAGAGARAARALAEHMTCVKGESDGEPDEQARNAQEHTRIYAACAFIEQMTCVKGESDGEPH